MYGINQNAAHHLAVKKAIQTFTCPDADFDTAIIDQGVGFDHDLPQHFAGVVIVNIKLIATLSNAIKGQHMGKALANL